MPWPLMPCRRRRLPESKKKSADPSPIPSSSKTLTLNPSRSLSHSFLSFAALLVSGVLSRPKQGTNCFIDI
ncbi:hypothetical protein MRB53_030407 [Persea americana]|uniref:Uncharacterized protein n=1 Tax=Persea americana TaxID=3435 RepID=A0ACC2KL81_PERAE|nr:hypothetical protein MRB53_030407 [Persea americana]